MKKTRSVEEILSDDTVLDDCLVEKISEKSILPDEKINAIISDGLSKIKPDSQSADEIKIDVVHKRKHFSYAAVFFALTVCLTLFVNIISSKNTVSPDYDSVADTEITINTDPEHKIYLYSKSFQDEGTIDTDGKLIQYMIFSENTLYVCSSDFSFSDLKLTAYNRNDRKFLFSEDIDDEGWIKYIDEDNGELEIIYQYKDNLKSVSFSPDKKFYNIQIPDNSFPVSVIPEMEGIYDCEILFCAEANGFMNYDLIYIRNDGSVYGYKEKTKRSYLITSDICYENMIPCAAADTEGIAVLK